MLNTDYLQARKVAIPNLPQINIVLVGCGGTGSWLAPTLARLARLLIDGLEKDVRVLFVDPDCVEEKNVYRQNFCHAEIGQNKAEALAFRYGLAWGVNIAANSTAFTHETKLPNGERQTLTVLLGCVDNGAARAELAQMAYNKANTWWIDCGNKKTIGQVLIGRARPKEYPLTLPGLCTWLPLPSVQHHELLSSDTIADAQVRTEDQEAQERGLSCAELAMRGSQSLTVNLRVAAIASEMLGRLLLTHDLEYYAAYVDQATGETRKFITDEAVDDFWQAKP